jgi:beta-aspartyl-peptidase (threonine type)
LKPSLIVHGGAAYIPPETLQGRRDGVRRALEAGWQVLSGGRPALEAVEAAIVVLENDPMFNAGTGAHLSRDGRVQLDAILMDGATLKAGAVAAVERVRNPIQLARCVLEKSEHMLLVAAGAEQFALQNGIALCAAEDLITAAARISWRSRLEELQAAGHPSAYEHGTVGAVALDGQGNLAAGTSTGGTPFKYPGRVGDSPLIGCGCYADVEAGGVSCTGHGEGIMKIVMAKMAVDLLRDPHALAAERQKNDTAASVTSRPSATTFAQAVADAAVLKLALRAGGSGGLILLDAEGRPAAAFNTPHMAHGFIEPGGSFRISP